MVNQIKLHIRLCKRGQRQLICMVFCFVSLITIVLLIYTLSFCTIYKGSNKQLYRYYCSLSINAQVLKTVKKYSSLNRKSRNSENAILIALDDLAALKYIQQINALWCYAYRHGYTFYLLEPSVYPECFLIDNFFFRKHCGVLFYLIENPEIKWVMVLDGDNLLVNASNGIENFLPKNNVTHIVYYERFYNGEVMAGNYLIRNHYWSHSYLLKWINLHKHIPDVHYHNNDNGALHIHLLLALNKNPEIINKCFSLWNRSIDENTYDQYVGCVKCALAGQRNFAHIQILRRGHGFARDYREPENLVLENDFLLHSYKADTNLYYVYPVQIASCNAHWNPPVHKYLIEHNLTVAQNLIKYYDNLASIKHPYSVGWPDVGNCWPNCEPELDKTTERKLCDAICK